MMEYTRDALNLIRADKARTPREDMAVRLGWPLNTLEQRCKNHGIDLARVNRATGFELAVEGLENGGGSPPGLGAADDLLAHAVPHDLLARAVGDVAEVGQRGDAVADVQIEHGLLARFEAVQEVPDVRCARVAAVAGLPTADLAGIIEYDHRRFGSSEVRKRLLTRWVNEVNAPGNE